MDRSEGNDPFCAAPGTDGHAAAGVQYHRHHHHGAVCREGSDGGCREQYAHHQPHRDIFHRYFDRGECRDLPNDREGRSGGSPSGGLFDACLCACRRDRDDLSERSCRGAAALAASGAGGAHAALACVSAHFFLALPGILVYNFASAIFRSQGDTKTPLFCLAAAGVIKVIISYTLVAFFIRAWQLWRSLRHVRRFFLLPCW